VWGIHVISPEEERKATVGRTCRKVRFKAWNERVRGDEIGLLTGV